MHDRSVTDPLLQPFQLKHLVLKNRIMTTSHEPAYPEDGMPKGRYCAYHAERARGGVALTMTAGSAAVSRDSPPVFNNILAYQDEVVPWVRDLTDACHEHGCAVMIQLTHLGRRTSWNKGDWLPSVAQGHIANLPIGPFQKFWKIGTSPGLLPIIPMLQNVCRRGVWTVLSCMPADICWTNFGHH